MYLKRIELLGFKSFASKTALELDRGVTALVGPNGSGKSNVVDAVRWALGEQSLRAVRSRKSEEVIFAGNARRPAVGMAEVTLVLDNSDGALPLSFAEVSITRRQYRSGESEYLINRARARLKDVVELLTHASLTPDGYAVVGQGAVDAVLLQRPEERRVLLETAADITRHQMKLRESLDRLAETEVNIRRVEDIRGEIAPRLSKLRAQANRARRYEEVTRRLREALRLRYLLEIRHLAERAAADLALESRSADAAAEAARAQEASRQRVAGLRDRLREEESALDAARERMHSLRLEKATREREAALAKEREESLRRQLEEAGEELARARKERQDLEAELEGLKAAQSELVARESAALAEMAPVEAARTRAASEQRLLQAQLERVVADQRKAAARRSELQERRDALARESRRAEEVRAAGLQAAAEATAGLAKLEEQLAASQQELERLRAELAETQRRHREARLRLEAAGEELERARRKEREAWERERDLRNRLSLLRSLKVEHRGLPPGAKAILDARLPGIRGTLVSTMRVPDEYVVAISAALGGAQGYVVSEDFEEGLDALQFLAERSEPATIAPLRIESSGSWRALVSELRSRLDGSLDGIAFRGVAADLVACDPEAEDLRARYLGLSLVVESMADALELYRRLLRRGEHRLPFQVVTLDGRLLRARGDLASTRDGEKNGSLLAREAELLALSESAERAQGRFKEARDAVLALESAHASLSRAVAEEAEAESRLQAEIGKLSAVRGELSAQVAKLEAAMEWHRSRVSDADRDLARAAELLSRTESGLAEARSLESELRGRAERLQRDLSEHQSALAEVAAQVSRLQSSVSAAQSRRRELGATIAALSEGLRRAEARAARQEERVEQLEQSLALLSRDPVSASLDSLVGELEAIDRQVAEASTRVARLRSDHAAAESELNALSPACESARDELSTARSRVQRTSAELAALMREAARECGLDLEQAEDEAPAALVESANRVAEMVLDQLPVGDADRPPGPARERGGGDSGLLAEVSREVNSLRQELQSLGTINADAPEEYRQVSERHAFLTTQLDDLRSAERTLRKAIEELRRLMEVRFQEVFDLVNSEFGRSFTTLFGGGSARLVLTQPEQPLQGGVEVLASPPGRRAGSLLGLSGGERALTAVALLFALMKVNPSPFCLLDEVDAALDDSNVLRFCQMVRDLAERTQFLLITHNRATMEMASALYGVSMSPDSVSRVVSLRLA